MNKWLLFPLLALFGIALIVGILTLFAFRKRLKNTTTGSDDTASWLSRHQGAMLLAFGIAFIACVLASTFYYSDTFLPSATALPASKVTGLFTFTLVLTSIAFFLTQVLLFVFAFRFRNTSRRVATFNKGDAKLEFVWTIVPAICFLLLFVWGQFLWSDINTIPDDALEVEITAQQFLWKVRYGGADGKLGRSGYRYLTSGNDTGVDVNDPHAKDDFIPVQMHVPRGRPVKLLLRSNDVIHSFYIPMFQIKMDAVPGMITTTHFTANTTTEEMRAQLNNENFDYEVACAELCGRMHFAMKLILVVDEPAEFERWYHHQKTIAAR
jgi:cytochrome c oxidase subunit 2